MRAPEQQSCVPLLWTYTWQYMCLSVQHGFTVCNTNSHTDGNIDLQWPRKMFSSIYMGAPSTHLSIYSGHLHAYRYIVTRTAMYCSMIGSVSTSIFYIYTWCKKWILGIGKHLLQITDKRYRVPASRAPMVHWIQLTAISMCISHSTCDWSIDSTWYILGLITGCSMSSSDGLSASSSTHYTIHAPPSLYNNYSKMEFTLKPLWREIYTVSAAEYDFTGVSLKLSVISPKWTLWMSNILHLLKPSSLKTSFWISDRHLLYTFLQEIIICRGGSSTYLIDVYRCMLNFELFYNWYYGYCWWIY